MIQIIVLGLSFLLSGFIRAESLHIIPDRFEIDGINNRPTIKIIEKPDSFEIYITFKASDESLMDFLNRTYGASFLDLDFYRYDLNPYNFQFLSDAFENSLIVKDIQKSYFANKVYLTITTNKDYSKSELQQILLFGVVFGTIDAKITCAGNIHTDLCGKEIKRLPVFNQYKVSQNKALEQTFHDYLLLNQYNAFFQIENLKHDMSFIDASVKQTLFDDEKKCKTKLSPIQNRVCECVKTYSRNLSIKETLTTLAQKIYPKKIVEDNYDYYIFQSSRLNIHQLNTGIDFGILLNMLNSKLHIETRGEIPEISSNIENSLTPDFSLSKLFWDGTKIVAEDLLFKGLGKAQVDVIFKIDINTSFDFYVSFTYDVITKEVNIYKTIINNFNFLNGINIPNEMKQIIADSINGYLKRYETVSTIKENIRDEILSLQSQNTAIFSLQKN